MVDVGAGLAHVSRQSARDSAKFSVRLMVAELRDGLEHKQISKNTDERNGENMTASLSSVLETWAAGGRKFTLPTDQSLIIIGE